MQVKFKKEYDFEGKKYGAVELDLENLTGKDLIDVERNCRAMGDASLAITLSTQFHLLVAGKASKLPVEFFYQLNIGDASKVAATVQGFLFEQD